MVRHRVGVFFAIMLAATALAVVVFGSDSAGAVKSKCPWLRGRATPTQRAHAVLRAMTLDDKIAMVHQPDPIWSHYGVAGYIPPNSRLCIPDLMLNDAGSGVGDMETGTVAFPVPIAQASSWDTTLQRQFGRRLGWEAWHKGVNVQLAPDVNIARVPMNGRNSEAFGEDPYLVAQSAAAEIKGIQENPVIATIKHYALNNNEQNRMTVSVHVDPRTLHEIYMPAFQTAVQKAHVGSVMCSYNRIAGAYACQNRYMLTKVLKHEFGFKGWVMSDWNGTHSTVPSALAGLDMEMGLGPGTYFGSALKAAVQSGKVPMSRLNDMVLRILRSMFQTRIFWRPHAAEPQAYSASVETPGELALARQVSEEGTVLLKNAKHVLPIQGTGKRIAVIGLAGGPAGTEESYNTGGSSHIPESGAKSDLVTPFQGIQQRGQSDSDVVTYSDGSSTADAVAAAQSADIAIVFANDEESEGNDRPNLSLADAQNCNLAGCVKQSTDQNALIRAVTQANPHTVVVLDTGGPMFMPWLHSVRGVLQAWYPGQEDGDAIASLLFGDVDPSGKLPQTFPRSMSQLPTRTKLQYPGVSNKHGIPQERYSERLLVGYRWYDAKHLKPLFPFGYGLSYTTFALRHAHVRAVGHGGALVSLRVTNTGSRAGAQVPEIYVGLPRATGEPPQRLAAYTRVFLAPGATSEVKLLLDRRAFSYWSSPKHSWVEISGCDRVMVGTSSRHHTSTMTVAVGHARCAGAAARIPLKR
ncbi:MAG: beta-glucosidase family protein [Solirubrobacteraceae bacterium]